MQKVEEKIVKIIRKKTPNFQPKIGLILGSGWNYAVNSMENATAVPYIDIKRMLKCNVKGHNGRFVLGSICGVDVLVAQGRQHLYEGYNASEATLLIRIMKEMEIDTVILTNSGGGINRNFSKGDIVLIKDHINLQGANCLKGLIQSDTKPVFIDMGNAYDKELRNLTTNIFPDMKEGVYVGLTGPNYETRAEIKFLDSIGADIVGMSTVQETIMANYLGMRVLALSFVSNMSSIITDAEISHNDVLEEAVRNQEKMANTLYKIIENINS